MPTSKLEKIDIKVSEKFIEKFSKLYIKQRSDTKFDFKELDNDLLFKKHEFKGEEVEKIIKRDSVARDIKREAGEKPAIINDIYRSDLGELLLTYFFEDKLSEEERFVLPRKNITDRELATQPGRGLDAIGYREKGDKIELLIGEAKVSEQKKNPPDVVDYAKDSIYKTQLKFKNNLDLLRERLSDYARKLSDKDAAKVTLAIMLIETKRSEHFDLVFVCSLIRDTSNVIVPDDYGKFYTQQTDFDPYQVHFCVLNFDKEINETVELFYNKVHEICSK
jgi:hypothetical protein